METGTCNVSGRQRIPAGVGERHNPYGDVRGLVMDYVENTKHANKSFQRHDKPHRSAVSGFSHG